MVTKSRFATRWGCALLLLALSSAAAQAPPGARTTAPGDLQEYRHTAFLPADAASCGVRSMTPTPDGFLWIATPTGLFRFDGAHFDMDLGNRLPSPSIRAGGFERSPAAAGEAVCRDGVWGTDSARLRFTLRPAFYEMAWFKILCGMILVVMLTILFAVRLDQAQRRYRRGMHERHAERERIARDVHDTLLQGVQALLFRLQMWEEDPDIPAPLRAEFAAVATQTKSIVIEGRERILMMRRTDAQPVDLAESLAAVGNEASAGKAARFEVTIAGGAKSLTVAAKEQLLDIAREAVRNAYQHARAGHVSVHLEYRKRALHMSIADDGQGIDPNAACRAQSTHFGLVGMRERARQLGAKFHIGSNGNGGTRVEVIVPARVAFLDAFVWPWQPRI